MKMLGVAAAADAVIWTGFYFHESGATDPIDTAEIGLIGGVFSLLVLVMVVGTPHWSARAAGLLETSIGTAVLFGTTLWTRLHQTFIDLPYQGQVYHIPIARPDESLIDLGRATFAVGGVLLLYGIIVWVHANWGPPSDGYAPTHMLSERRSGRDRRLGWGKHTAREDIVVEHKTGA